MRKALLKKIRITTSLMEGGYVDIPFDMLPTNTEWGEAPIEVIGEDSEGRMSFIMTGCTETARVYSNVCMANSRFTKVIHSDCDEYYQVGVGKLIDLVTGTIVNEGETFKCVAGQVHHIVILEDSIFQVSLIKK